MMISFRWLMVCTSVHCAPSPRDPPTKYKRVPQITLTAVTAATPGPILAWRATRRSGVPRLLDAGRAGFFNLKLLSKASLSVLLLLLNIVGELRSRDVVLCGDAGHPRLN